MPATRWRRTSFILMAALAAICVSVATREAAHRPLWLDEVYGLDQSIRNVSFAQLFINGALGQGSPSPLDYVLVKCLDRVRSEVRYLGLEPHVYFRLIAMLSTLIAGVCAFQMAMRPGGREATGRARALVTVLAVCAMLSLVLDPMIFHFAGEVRPYALWTACWFLAAGSFLWQGRNARGWQFVLLVALSLTATASVFQLVALGAASSSVELARGKTLATVVQRTLTLFTAPTGLALYYCFKVQPWNYPAGWRTWSRFLPFWGSHAWVAVLSLTAVALCLIDRRTVTLATPPLAMLILYLMGPFVFWVTEEKGFFFTERQYLYYGTAVPLVCVVCAGVLSSQGLTFRRARLWLLVLLICFCGLDAIRVSTRTADVIATAWRGWETTSGIPADPQRVLATLLNHELPSGFCFTAKPSDVSAANVSLVAAWMPVHYCNLKVGHDVVLLMPRGDGAEVLGLASTCRSGTLVRILAPK